MIRRQIFALLLLLALLVPYATFGQQPAADSNDAVARIIKEEKENSQVMQTLSYLSDVIGPRLTASPNAKRANEWTRDKLTSWGLQNGHLEAWGPFGRGWTLKRFSAQIVEPQDIPLIAYPKAWSPGIKVMPSVVADAKNRKKGVAPAPPPSSTVTADVIYLDAKTEADLEKYKGQLKGKIVLISPTVEVKALCSILWEHAETKRTCWRWRTPIHLSRRRIRRRWRRRAEDPAATNDRARTRATAVPTNCLYLKADEHAC